jgi:four helix bundle protein
MARSAFTTLHVYQLSERIADAIWDIVLNWDSLARDTVGKQLIRAADSIGANIAEGFGRGYDSENRRYVRIARGSLNETHHFLRRAFRRRLLKKSAIDDLTPLLDELGPRLNAYLRGIGRKRASLQKRPTNNKQQTTNSR